jgi:dipeptidase
MTIMRDKCAGTDFDPLRGLRGGPFGNPYYDSSTRTIGTNHAEYTTVTQSRSAFPGPIGGIVWLALGSQDTSCFVPFYAGISDLPDSYRAGDHWIFSRNSARWAFDYTDFHVQVVYNAAIEDVRAAQERWEMPAINRTPEIDKQALELYHQDPAKATEFLTGYCLDNARSVVDAWWELGDRLLVKYNKLGTYDMDKRSAGRSKSQTVPDWWRKMVRVYDAILEPADR